MIKLWTLALLCLAGAALAQDAPPQQPQPPQEEVFVAAYGAKNPACLAWTDSCQLCLRAESGRIVCSTPGIACVAGPIVCTRAKPDQPQ